MQEHGDARSSRVSLAGTFSPLEYGALLCDNFEFPITKEMLLSISPKLHNLVFAAVDLYCGQIGYHDFDGWISGLNLFLEAGSRSFVDWYIPRTRCLISTLRVVD